MIIVKLDISLSYVNNFDYSGVFVLIKNQVSAADHERETSLDESYLAR